ncbi:hypothetical protein F5Y09DRAFT_338438 [Xylaria sp. FL1042]|nr:hypothetical protein F5Y09DRAFT_338438 [Xylaria sp. FL1042]
MSLSDFASLPPDTQEQILDGPSLRPPKGVESNFEHPQNLDALAIFILVLCGALAHISIFFCVYGKWYLLRIFRAGDSVKKVFSRGVFVHLWDIEFRELRSSLWLVFIMQNLYFIVTGLLQTAMLSEWIRIFCPTPAHRGAYYSVCCLTLTFNVIWWILYLCILNTQCTPHSYIWDKTLSGSCLRMEAYDVLTAVVNLVLDLIIAMLFLGKIGRFRQLRHRGRVILTFTLTIGSVVCILAGGRLMSTLQYFETHDSSYEGSAIALWSFGEMSCGFFAFAVSGLQNGFYEYFWRLVSPRQNQASIELDSIHSGGAPDLHQPNQGSPYPALPQPVVLRTT